MSLEVKSTAIVFCHCTVGNVAFSCEAVIYVLI